MAVANDTFPIDLDAAAASLTFTGALASDRLGASVAGGLDVNGDGRDDILLGAHTAGGSSRGRAYLVLSDGPVDFDAATPRDIVVISTAAEVELTGEAGLDYAGRMVALAGDMDGDNRAELVIGAPYNDEGGGSADLDVGAGKIFLGLSSDLIRPDGRPVQRAVALSAASHTFPGTSLVQSSGSAIAARGDVDGDGTPDLWIGAPGAGNAANGAVFLFLARDFLADAAITSHPLSEASAVLAGTAGEGVFPLARGVADLDGDGRDDMLVGAPRADWEDGANGPITLIDQTGEVWVIFGASPP